ncbi:MAG: hypothetical protein OXT74_11055 [Candidatus Poribacteria bacterium]|nr:hypothetical protein [Candidatus Poribacteria bacterium]
MHFKRSEDILTAAVDTSAKLQVETESVEARIIGGLYGSGCEFILRNRGLHVPVAPILPLRQGLWAWLGYREEWDEERRNRRYSFRSVGLSIHFGLKNDVFKPQMFRAEWAGWARWSGLDYSFQAADAAHPHWQFDALDSLPDDKLSQRAAQLLNRLQAEVEPKIREFYPQLSSVDVRDLVTVQKLSRIHFASAAAWWKSPPHDEHVHGPADLVDIENWVRHSLDYIKVELDRL